MIIGRLKGEVAAIGSDSVMIDVGGVGYVALAGSRLLSKLTVGAAAEVFIGPALRVWVRSWRSGLSESLLASPHRWAGSVDLRLIPPDQYRQRPLWPLDRAARLSQPLLISAIPKARRHAPLLLEHALTPILTLEG